MRRRWQDRAADIIRGRVREYYNTVSDDFIKLSGFSRATYYNRLKEPETFVMSEFQRVVDAAHLSDEEIITIVRRRKE